MAHGTSPTVLLTNDDGIESAGLQILYEELSEFADVTVVAPTVDHSGIGRVLSFGRSVPLETGTGSEDVELTSSELAHEVSYTDHELGYAVEGTPCDCVIAGITALEIHPDIVVSGCNPGPNLGVASFGRSGTVSAAVEAAHLGVPGVAVSHKDTSPTRKDYHLACEFAHDLVEFISMNEAFENVDYLNVSIPSSEITAAKLTRPVEGYGFTARVPDSENVFEFTYDENGGEFTASESDLLSDREALKLGMASVTPFQLPFTPTTTPELRRFVNQHSE
jgi:5'-nucleotidase